MAQALLARRIWTLSTKVVRCLPASTASISSSSTQTSFFSSVPSRVSFLPPSRTLFDVLPDKFPRVISAHIQNKEHFKYRVISSDVPVLVYFRAEWCGPCMIHGVRMEKAVANQEGRVFLAKVDIDEHPDLAIEYGVSAVPTVIAVRGGKVVDRFEGMKDPDQLNSFITKFIRSYK